MSRSFADDMSQIDIQQLIPAEIPNQAGKSISSGQKLGKVDRR